MMLYKLTNSSYRPSDTDYIVILTAPLNDDSFKKV